MPTFFNKLIIIFVFSVINFLEANAQTLHFYIITQNDSNIGASTNRFNMQNLAEKIQENVPNLEVKLNIINGAVASKERIASELSSARIGSNDVVWYYYSGHGRNYDTWPMSAEQDVSLTWVHAQLKNTSARLSLAMYDCCSYLLPLAAEPEGLQAKSTFYKILFLESKGHIISASCSSTQISYGHPNSGGLFTNSFIDALGTHSNWDDVLANAKSMTIENARNQGQNQVPIYDIVNGQVNMPSDAPSLKPKWFSSLTDIAHQLTLNSQANGKSVTISVKDLQRWNPGLTEQNFKTFKELYFNFEDPLIEEFSNEYPIFSFPCPTPSCAGELPFHLLLQNSENQTNVKLKNIENKLSDILEASGYFEKRYFRTEDNNGFVVATKLEKIDPNNGIPVSNRFKKGRTKLNFSSFSFIEYLEQLLFPEKGHYRILVFVVSKDLLMEKGKIKDTKVLQEQIYGSGNPNLPHTLAEEIISLNEYNCNILVYEFEQKGEEQKIAILENSKFQAQDHLIASGIYKQLLKK